MDNNLSVVIPTYNRAQTFLKKAIESVLNQTYKKFEFIIVDDASTDNTSELVNSFNDKRIVYFQTDHNHGEYWATNYGISLTKGKYICLVHSDDVLPPNSLLIRYNILINQPELDFVHGNIVVIDENDQEITRKNSTDDHSIHVFQTLLRSLTSGKMNASLVHHVTIMMKRNFFYKAGPYEYPAATGRYERDLPSKIFPAKPERCSVPEALVPAGMGQAR